MEKELMEFIEQHNLDFNDFYNAHGLPVSSCYPKMKSLDKLFAYNTTPCSNFGHTIRDRQGHCIACNTANIAFSIRKKQIGYIYIACSLKKETTKVGMTTEKPHTRLSKLNSRKVGNTDDWEIIKYLKCAKANSLELQIQEELKKYLVKGDLYGDTESKEIFRCSYHKANELLQRAIKNNGIKVIEEKSLIYNADKYQFRNLISK